MTLTEASNISFLHEVTKQAFHDRLHDGIKAAVWTYYDSNRTAKSLPGDLYDSLTTIGDYLDVDFDTTIRTAEADIQTSYGHASASRSA